MIWVVGGTSDTRMLLDKLLKICDKSKIIVSVTTEYGEKLILDYKIKISNKTLEKSDIQNFIKENNITTIIDTSHPYAQNVSKNIIDTIELSDIKYFRYERSSTAKYDGLEFEDLETLIEYVNLNLKNKTILSTLGTKSLDQLSKITDNKLFVRVLPTLKSIEKSEKLGFLPNQIIAIQGPFSKALEKEMLIHYKIDFVLTKESGIVGGTQEKVDACKELGIQILTLSRPKMEYPNKYDDIDGLLEAFTNIKV